MGANPSGVSARNKKDGQAVSAARAEGRLLSQTILSAKAADALRTICATGKTKRGAIEAALIDYAKKSEA